MPAVYVSRWTRRQRLYWAWQSYAARTAVDDTSSACESSRNRYRPFAIEGLMRSSCFLRPIPTTGTVGETPFSRRHCILTTPPMPARRAEPAPAEPEHSGHHRCTNWQAGIQRNTTIPERHNRAQHPTHLLDVVCATQECQSDGCVGEVKCEARRVVCSNVWEVDEPRLKTLPHADSHPR